MSALLVSISVDWVWVTFDIISFFHWLITGQPGSSGSGFLQGEMGFDGPPGQFGDRGDIGFKVGILFYLGYFKTSGEIFSKPLRNSKTKFSHDFSTLSIYFKINID